MQSIIHLTMSAILAFHLWMTFKTYRQNKEVWTLALFAVIFGLVYDNFALGLGRFVGEGEMLKALNAPRYWIHALFTPLMIIFAWYVAKRAGLGWAQKIGGYALFGTLTLIMIGIGVNEDILKLELGFAQESDVLRYRNLSTKGPPIPAIVAILTMVIVGVLLAWKKKWPWLAIGAILMFVFTAGDRMLPDIFTNIGEISLALGALATDRRFTLHRKEMQLGLAAALR